MISQKHKEEKSEILITKETETVFSKTQTFFAFSLRLLTKYFSLERLTVLS